MIFLNIRNTLVNYFNLGGFDLPVSFPNISYDASEKAFAELDILPSQPNAVTMGDYGEDEHKGIFQIDLYYPTGKGDMAILTKADQIARHFKAGTKYSYESQEVFIESCGVSNGRQEQGRYRMIITINYRARISRTGV